MVNEQSVNRVYLRKARHTCGMNGKGHILAHLGEFEKTPTFWSVKMPIKTHKGYRVQSPDAMGV